MGSREILNGESNALSVFVGGCIEILEFFLGIQNYFFAISIDI